MWWKANRGSPSCWYFSLTPEDQAPQSPDLPPIPEELQQTQQTDPSVQTLEQRVDVEKDHAGRRGFISNDLHVGHDYRLRGVTTNKYSTISRISAIFFSNEKCP